ncbi:hypothetical protein DRA43_17370 [Micromonospora provocatoris]|nr:hypothetical protein DRA43_17370 [Micromonospora provocatoris]
MVRRTMAYVGVDGCSAARGCGSHFHRMLIKELAAFSRLPSPTNSLITAAALLADWAAGEFRVLGHSPPLCTVDHEVSGDKTDTKCR